MTPRFSWPNNIGIVTAVPMISARFDAQRTGAITRDPVLVDLALQGGGSHGAFTWGVLDRLLEEPWLEIDGISGTSAGAMNAAVLADGYAKGGPSGAREALEKFWRRVSDAARFSPFKRGPLDVILGRWTLDSSPMYVAMDLMSRLLSPYQLNPKGSNPLREILADLVDFERLAQSSIKLFITATNVRTGRGHVFKNGAITPDVLLSLLHDEGRRSAQVFLETHAMDLGSRSTLNIDALLEQV
jgi:NTE family protein